MLEYDRIDVSEGINVNKASSFRKCIIFHYWYFLEVSFRFQPKVCNVCHALMQDSMIFNNVVIVSVKRNDYKIDFLYISKMKPINIMKNSDLSEGSR